MRWLMTWYETDIIVQHGAGFLDAPVRIRRWVWRFQLIQPQEAGLGPGPIALLHLLDRRLLSFWAWRAIQPKSRRTRVWLLRKLPHIVPHYCSNISVWNASSQQAMLTEEAENCRGQTRLKDVWKDSGHGLKAEAYPWPFLWASCLPRDGGAAPTHTPAAITFSGLAVSVCAESTWGVREALYRFSLASKLPAWPLLASLLGKIYLNATTVTPRLWGWQGRRV